MQRSKAALYPLDFVVQIIHFILLARWWKCRISNKFTVKQLTSFIVIQLKWASQHDDESKKNMPSGWMFLSARYIGSMALAAFINLLDFLKIRREIKAIEWNIIQWLLNFSVQIGWDVEKMLRQADFLLFCCLHRVREGIEIVGIINFIDFSTWKGLRRAEQLFSSARNIEKSSSVHCKPYNNSHRIQLKWKLYAIR